MSVISRLRDAGFEVLTRKEWGSPRQADGSYARRAASSSYRLAPGRPYHYLHITVTGDTDTVLEGKAGARQVEAYGLSTPPMVSYQMLVTNEGRIFEGQSYGVKGTHTVNDKGVPGFPHDLNREGYAVAIMQNVQDEVTDEQVRAIAACFAAAELEGHVRRGAPIFPHRKFDWKSCPGDKAVARLGEIQRLKDQMVREGINQEDDMANHADQLNKIERLATKAVAILEAERKRARLRTERLRKRLDQLDASAKDDATKEQVKALRADLAELEALFADETPEA